MNEEKRFEQVENGIQERLLTWVVRRDKLKRILLRIRSRIFLGEKIFGDTLEMYRIACEGVEASFDSVKSLRGLRRLRFRMFVIKRIENRRES